MGAINPANFKKTLYYLQRNGLRDTWYAARERLTQGNAPYVYERPSAESLSGQRETAIRAFGPGGAYEGIAFSVLVPAYRTPRQYLRDLILSVQAQSYPFWELILADATEDESVKACVEEMRRDIPESESQKLRYIRLPDNKGISGNTNEALKHVTNPYVALLDHDDLLTPDALFEMAEAIRAGRESGQSPMLLYSDEDKCDETGEKYYEPNKKEGFNYDLTLSNNYICHFMAMESGLIRTLQFRSGYDGAQDYDLILRAVTELGIPRSPERERLIRHVPKVLYHWRCHEGSTAANPRSKDFAYEAGRRALQDHADQNGIPARAVPLKHLGFYRLDYPGGILAVRPDLGAVGGTVVRRGRIAGGRMDAAGRVFYAGLPVRYSGELHRAVLTQDAEAVDIRRVALREELHELFREVTGVPYRRMPDGDWFDVSLLPPDTDYAALSLALCRAVRERGFRILWYPGGH
ncbi:MAG: glycosyltransferase [Clostridium sp.]|nr:glycosyltransferase [Acetatifactor muris]MCM1527832.1 glycosyltransferase [Bacteroides sp.]MCM1563511.1 glycosyltransferase [Clostridium sp.]